MIGVSLRVDAHRDGLEQTWFPFLAAAGLLPLLLPNHLPTATALLPSVRGLLLTGGNDLIEVGGDAPERDQVETHLIQYALDHNLPLLAVCRGAQRLHVTLGGTLERRDTHAGTRHTLSNGRTVTSYHKFILTHSPCQPLLTAADGTLESFRHPTAPLMGLMWHPERESPYHPDDLTLFQEHFHARTHLSSGARLPPGLSHSLTP